MKYIYYALVTTICMIATTAYSQQIQWISSTNTKCWAKNTINIENVKSNCKYDIIVNPQKSYQTIEGFGSCFNELGWQSLNSLNEAQRNSILSELYAPNKGANFTLGRMPVASNDFSINYYSYDETDGDFDMKNFSIAHDKSTLLPFIKAAMRFQPKLKLWASPWCPPKWMKKNKHYAENSSEKWNAMVSAYIHNLTKEQASDPLRFRITTLNNDTPTDSMGYEGVTSFNMDKKYLKAYASYFGKFVDAYKKNGVNIYMVMPQNEPNSAQPYPSCSWTSKDLNTFVGKYLGPEMTKHNVKVFFGTIERPDPLKVDTIINDPYSKQYVKGVGFQWAGKDALPTIYKQNTKLALYGTEQECGNGLNNWEGAMHSWELMKHYFNNGVNAYFYWNTALFANKASTWGWYQNSLVTVDNKTKTYKFTPEYYVMKHVSHFVKHGAKRIEVAGKDKNVLAFINPDKSIIVVVGNSSNMKKSITIKILNHQIRPTILPKSLNTFYINK